MARPVLAALLLLGSSFCAAQGEATGFLGHWDNPDPKASGLIHLQVSPNGGDRVQLRAYGDCHPSVCNWGLVQGHIYGRDPASRAVESITASFHYGFADRVMVLRKTPDGRLHFEMLTGFSDNPDKHDFASDGELVASSWAGPISNWDRPPSSSTGWGGGARTGIAPEPKERCLPFDPAKTRAVEVNGLWKIKAGEKTLADAGADEKSALLAQTALRHYRFDRRCTVGGPFKTYWKAGSGFSSDRMGGVECIAFNPTTAHLVLVGRDWKLVDGPDDIAVLGANKPKAEAMLGLIRYHRLTQECFVRRVDPVMTFWLKD
jgi:hypothetical protein